MPGFIVTGPDGREWDVDVPDGATEQDAIAYVQSQYYGSQDIQGSIPGLMQPPPVEQSQQADLTRTDRFVRGIGDAPTGVGQLMVNAGYRPSFEDSMMGSDTERYGNMPTQEEADARAAATNQRIAEEEAAYQAARGDGGVDWVRLLGNVVGTAPVAAGLPGAGQTVLGTAVRGALSGGGLASTMPVTEEGDYFSQKAGQTALGAATGFFGSGALDALARMGKPAVDRGLQYLLDRGVRPTVGQMTGRVASRTEDKLTGIPALGDAIAGGQRRAIQDFNRAAYQEALNPIGARAPSIVGRDGIAETEKIISGAYRDILPDLKFKADGQFMQELKDLQQLTRNMPKPQQRRFNQILKDQIFTRLGKSGTMDGQTLKGVESELNKIARGYLSDASFDNRELGSAVRTVLDSIRTTLQRTNPSQAERLASINASWATFKRIQDAAARAGTDDGVFTPAQLLSAVRSGDRSVSRGAFARGDALLQDFAETGKNILGARYPDSGTSGRLAAQLVTAGGVGYVSPTALAAGLGASSLYTQPGQRIAQAILTGTRPTWLQGASGVLRRSAIPVGAGAGLVGVNP